MTTPGQILRELHRLRSNIFELDDHLEQAPRIIKARANRVVQLEAALKQTQDDLKQLKMRMHEKELSIKSTEQQNAKYEKQLGEISSKKEYDTLRAEIAAGKERIRSIEDEVLVLMGQIEEKSAELPGQEQAIKTGRADLQQFEAEQHESVGRWTSEKQRAEAELRQVESALPTDVKSKYARLVTSMGHDALAAVNEGVCAACYTGITPQMRHDLVKGVCLFCKNCGRLLYLAS